MMGRYERTTVHQLIQRISILDIPWLGEPVVNNKLAGPDFKKRKTLLVEFVYWIFATLVPDIISSFFFVTESATSHNKLLYFRHDVWIRLSKMPLQIIKQKMFEPIPSSVVARLVGDSRRTLGIGTVRLMPKETGLRLIMRLSSKTAAKVRISMSNLNYIPDY